LSISDLRFIVWEFQE